MNLVVAQDRILELCTAKPGITQADIEAYCPQLVAGDALADAINALLQGHRLELFHNEGGHLVYRATSASNAQKYKGLTKEELLVFQTIQATGNTGAWSRDLKMRTNLTQPALAKILKNLEARKLIKAVRTVGAGASKKVWMDADLEPASHITGGSWYTDHELDAEFIHLLREACKGYVQRNPDATLEDVAKFLNARKVSQVELQVKDFGQILDTLVLDAEVVRIRGPSGDKFRVAPPSARLPTTALTSMPCGLCPVASECTPEGAVSPSKCEYYAHWLDTF